MPAQHKPEQYRQTIDALVQACQDGPGQVGASRVHSGQWNLNAAALGLEEARVLNELMKNLSTLQRNALANALVKEFEAGVFETLKLLDEHQIAPFDGGYEGGAHEDFIGRLGGWNWPE